MLALPENRSVLETFSLKGKVALVTGTLKRFVAVGIGKHIRRKHS